ncbi:HSP20-like chaperone [Phlebopus sp. FC_14]|nr:HSP20-like chaperone [Phlebopus sp. FC_14]
MSIARQLLHEFRPLFHMLEEPLATRTPMAYGLPHRSLFADPFFTSPNAFRPAVDVTEEGDTYVVEADLPGVKKENVDITIGDGGRSVTIQGRAFSRRENTSGESASKSQEASSGAEGEGSGAVIEATPNQLASERLYSGTSSFTRTVWLPRAVDSSKVSAKLADGILTLKVPKLEDSENVKITVE